MLMVQKDSISIRVKQAFADFMRRFESAKLGPFDSIFFFYTYRYGYICLHFPSKRAGWFLYVSPDSRQETSTFYIGCDRREAIKAKLRKELVGHNWLHKVYDPGTPSHLRNEILDAVKDLNVMADAIFNDFGLYLK